MPALVLDKLPREILLRIAYFLTPDPPSLSNIGDWPLVCSKPHDTTQLSDVSKLWREVTETARSVCIQTYSYMALSPAEFRELYDGLPYPELVRHLHLCTQRYALRYVDLYLSAFENLELVEVMNGEPSNWPELARALVYAPTVRTIILHSGVHIWHGVENQCGAPWDTETPLHHVKRFVVRGIGNMRYLGNVMTWMPALEKVVLRLDHKGTDAEWLGWALKPCAATLKYLDTSAWDPMRYFGTSPWDLTRYDLYHSTPMDLRHMKALEEVVLCSFTTRAVRPLEWRFPASVTRISDPNFSFAGTEQLNVYECIAALQQVASNCHHIAPGLKRLSINASKIRESFQKEMLLLVKSKFEAIGVELVCEGLT